MVSFGSLEPPVVLRFYHTNVVGDYHTATQLLQDPPLPPITKKSVTSALSLGRLLHFDHRNLETVRISITTYIAKRKIVHRTKLTFFQNHFTASGSPVDFTLPFFSLFVPDKTDKIEKKNWKNSIYGFLLICICQDFVLRRKHGVETVVLLIKKVKNQNEPVIELRIDDQWLLIMLWALW